MNIDYLHHDTRTDDPLQSQIETFTRWQDPTIKEMQKEIQRLNNENKQYKEYIKELKDSLRNYHIKNNKLINENKKSNNIMKELENFIETYAIPEFNLSKEPTRYFMETKIILERLKELKEGE